MSHASQGLFAATILFVTAASAAADPAVIDSKVNLRSGPGPAFGVIAVMPSGTKLDVQKCGDEWCRVKFGRQVGYANSAHIKSGVESYASVVPQAPPALAASQPTLAGPRIWQWRDEEWRDRHWRQLDWHNRLNSR